MTEIISLKQLVALPRAKAKRKIVINLDQTKYKVLSDIANLLEWKISSSETECHLIWKDTYVTDEEFRKLLPFQRVNHFPGSYLLGRKNDLCRNLNRMRRQCPDEYDFFPRTWQLPYQAEEVRARSGTYILKPEANCQGRGIFLTKKLDPFLDRHLVVQEYIANPFLIDGLKFDLRIYVLLKSVNPLKIFMYREGLARFSTSKYVKPHKKNLSSVTMHLTNYAINKKSKDFIFNTNEDEDNVGHKRSFSYILKYLQELGHDIALLLIKIKTLIVRTLQSVQSELSHLYRLHSHNNETIEQCFELFGFDILLDDTLKPWLLEVNHTPSFSTDTPLDKQIKNHLILDTLLLLDIRNKPKSIYLEQKRAPIYQRPQKKSNELKSSFTQQQSYLEDRNLNGFWRIWPLENAHYIEQTVHQKSKDLSDKRQSQVPSLPRRLITNQSFSDLDHQQAQSSYQLTSRNPNSRGNSAQRPASSITTIQRPASGLRRPPQSSQTQPQTFQKNLQYPPPPELPPRPVKRMIPIKTFSFEKIEQKNE